MPQAYESNRRKNGNGDLREHAIHVREDVSALQKDLTQLRNDIGTLMSLQWRSLGKRASDGALYVGEQVRAHPITSLGAVAGIGIIAGFALASMGANRDRR